MSDGLVELSVRVALLDGERGGPLEYGHDPTDLGRFVAVLSRITRPGTPEGMRALPAATASAADDMVAGSRLLRRLLDAAPEITAGPLRLGAQRWIATGRPGHLPRRHPSPSPAHFLDPTAAGPVRPDAKPFGLGLFTSTAALGGDGAWRTYLDLHDGSSLFPRPWATWSLEMEPAATVHEVSNAADWVELVRRHPLRAGALTYPDWASVAREHDGVHMTLRAIAATQGIAFPLGDGVVAAPYWDVESTLWLRWRVTSARLLGVTS